MGAAALAFPTRPDLVEEAKLGVLSGSFISATIGYLILRYASPLKAPEQVDSSSTRGSPRSQPNQL